MVDLARVFKAYDVRGVYPDELDEDLARRIGTAFARWVGAERVVLGRDCRPSSPGLSDAFVDGVTGEGMGVVDIGLATTDMVYFASGRLRLPGAMFTASHNPAELQRAEAVPGRGGSGRRGERAPGDPGPRRGRTPAVHRRGARDRRGPEHGRALPRAPPVLRGRRVPDAAPCGRRRRERHGRPRGSLPVRAPPAPPRSAVHGARRDVPEPSRGPDPAREPGGPEACRARRALRPRPGVRRRRRPGVPGRRGRPGRERLAGHGPRGPRHARAVPGRDDPVQRDLLLDRPGGRSGSTAACRSGPGSGTRSSSR